MTQFKLKILQKLIPGLRKEGYTEEVAEDSATTATTSTPRNPRPDPEMPPNAPENYPRFRIPPRSPLEIGRNDLDPIPMNPFTPPPLFPPYNNGDGMFVGPDHPIFGARRGGGTGGPFGERGPWGGDGYLPPMGAPPGARFDPVGPDVGHFNGIGGGGRGRGRGGPPGGGNMYGPDNDEFMPPGMVCVLLRRLQSYLFLLFLGGYVWLKRSNIVLVYTCSSSCDLYKGLCAILRITWYTDRLVPFVSLPLCANCWLMDPLPPTLPLRRNHRLYSQRKTISHCCLRYTVSASCYFRFKTYTEAEM
jgi:PI31 proteasome regulator